jgi:hypothetical protein
MNDNSNVKTVENLVTKAGAALNADDALKFSQAACNAANALRVLAEIAKNKSEH